MIGSPIYCFQHLMLNDFLWTHDNRKFVACLDVFMFEENHWLKYVAFLKLYGSSTIGSSVVGSSFVVFGVV